LTYFFVFVCSCGLKKQENFKLFCVLNYILRYLYYTLDRFLTPSPFTKCKKTICFERENSWIVREANCTGSAHADRYILIPVYWRYLSLSSTDPVIYSIYLWYLWLYLCVVPHLVHAAGVRSRYRRRCWPPPPAPAPYAAAPSGLAYTVQKTWGKVTGKTAEPSQFMM
jgi:hypothetical protein